MYIYTHVIVYMCATSYFQNLFRLTIVTFPTINMFLKRWPQTPHRLQLSSLEAVCGGVGRVPSFCCTYCEKVASPYATSQTRPKKPSATAN